ncbi:CBS domain-containing protein [Halorussus salinisoli]|uniref:CBS domain-containing protein n=1 Tax=Halorussus salinisoli TaxID=2558242 RepID=UPI0010C1822B|nr:CBS domain-containing protein [Halorussus salinisoli]
MGFTAEELAQKDVVTVEPDTSVSDVARTMRDRNVGSTVVTEDGAVVGIVTDRDLVLNVLTKDTQLQLDQENAGGSKVTVRELMTEDPLTVEADDHIQHVLRQMNEAKARRIPVVTDGEVTGILTFDDLVVHLAGESTHVSAQLDALAEVVHAESPEG